MVAKSLLNTERRMLKAMLENPSQNWSLSEILTSCDWQDQAVAVGAGFGLVDKGLVKVSELVTTGVRLAANGQVALQDRLLEARLWDWFKSSDNPTMRSLQESFEKHEAGPGVGLLKKLGLTIDAGIFTCSDESRVSDTIKTRQEFLANLPANANDLDSDLLNHFKNRRDFVELSDITVRSWSLTAAGRETVPETLVETTLVNEITPELLQSESWRSAEFRPFDVTLESATPRTGRSHPMQSLIERIRHIFLEMGFSELVEDYVQTAGWNMDALFIPQDHPAREMQDTFYLDNPKSIPLSEDMMATWSEIHLTGGQTKSTGWGGEFSKETSQKGLLRTHTTVNTIQYLANNPEKPCRMFTVDRVFRKEAIDRTHLPEFHQIEGIIHEENANLPMLISTLKTFYSKMGYDDVRVRPAYFPYTEPSVEVDILWRGEWLELGGAGIFRPEVTEPLGTEWPVCAWGMGLERLAMLVLGLDDIRQLYQPDLEKLARMPIL